MQMPHHILTTQMEPWGFIKPSAQNKIVLMKLSLCLSFYLRCSLGATRWAPPWDSQLKSWRL
jgi:hypothetical protein